MTPTRPPGNTRIAKQFSNCTLTTTGGYLSSQGGSDPCAAFRVVIQTEEKRVGRYPVLTNRIRPKLQLPPNYIEQSRKSPSHGSSARMRFGGFSSANPACWCCPTHAGQERGDIGPSGYLDRLRSESTGSFLMRNQCIESKPTGPYARNLPASSKTVRASSRRQKVPTMPVPSLGGWSPERRGDSSIVAYARLAEGPRNRPRMGGHRGTQDRSLRI